MNLQAEIESSVPCTEAFLYSMYTPMTPNLSLTIHKHVDCWHMVDSSQRAEKKWTIGKRKFKAKYSKLTISKGPRTLSFIIKTGLFPTLETESHDACNDPFTPSYFTPHCHLHKGIVKELPCKQWFYERAKYECLLQSIQRKEKRSMKFPSLMTQEFSNAHQFNIAITTQPWHYQNKWHNDNNIHKAVALKQETKCI